MSRTKRTKSEKNNQKILDEYQRFGYVVVPNLLKNEQVADFLNNEQEVPSFGSSPQSLQPFRNKAHWHNLVSNRRILEVVVTLLGSPARVVEALYLPKPTALEDDASRSGVPFHRDRDHIRTEPDTLIGCWVALNRTDSENGGFCVIPSTHIREPKRVKARTSIMRGFELKNHMRNRSGKEWVEKLNSAIFSNLDPEEILPLSIPRGAGVFFHGGLVHGSYSNISVRRRRLAASIHYVAEGTWVFRTDIQNTMALPFSQSDNV